MAKFFLSAALLAVLALPVYAQQTLKLEIHDGRVNLDAAAVPARQILTEWARVGGTKVVGGDKVTGPLLTLRLINMPERQALDIILRNVAGYMAAPRLASSMPGASSYDRILILPTSSAPTTAPANAGLRMPNTGAMGGVDRRVPPRPPGLPSPVEPDVSVEQPEIPDPDDVGFNGQTPVFTFPQPQPQGNQLFVPVPQGGFGMQGQPGAQPPIMLQPGTNGQPTIYNFVPTTPGQPPATGGFNIFGSPTPGVIQPPPVQPGQIVPAPRPPGGN
jgi:hypothetical protein